MNAFLHGNGGGTSLNFSVKAFASLPETASLNTIAVITETAVEGWTFDINEPANPASGSLWFTTSTASTAAFNALKTNALYIYPISCKQYVGGAWQSVAAYMWDGNAWVEVRLPMEYLIENGVIDLTAHPYTSGDSTTINNSYNGTPAVRLGAGNGEWTTHQFDNVEVPEWATSFVIEYYLLATYQHDPQITLGAVTATIDRGGAEKLENGKFTMDISAVAGTTASLIMSFVGAAGNGFCYIGNAWFE